MSADDFVWLVTQAVFVAVFLDVSVKAVRQPRQASIDIALFFGAILAVIAISDIERLTGIAANLQTVSYVALSALPYLALRITDDLAAQQPWLMRLASGVLTVLIVAAVLVPQPWPLWFQLLPVLWFVIIGGHVTLEFLRRADRTSGVTARRMRAAAVGSALVGLVFVLAVVGVMLPVTTVAVSVLNRVLALAAGIAYFLAFAPPSVLRRAWQEPELRAFLGRAASLPRLPDIAAIRKELEAGAAAATGATAASIGLWDARRERLVYVTHSGELFESESPSLIGNRAFNEQRRLFSGNAARDDPDNAEVYRSREVGTVLAAPISAGDKRIGVLTVYASRAPIFADDDLRLVQLLADQAAVILESRALIDEASRVQAREEATRLKDDFLSAAAHDLRSPLTTLLLHAEMMKRGISSRPDAPPEERRIDAIVREGNRLKSLVGDFLDAARAERGNLLGRLERVDLVGLVRESADRLSTTRHPVRVEADDPVIGQFAADRVRQVVDNLIENAIKYSPDGGEVVARVRTDAAEGHIEVSDAGIGIPADDLAHLFDRFHRGTNVDDRRFQGLGLGLYICRAIVEDHGGRISAESTVGVGSTFRVALPLEPAEPATAEVDRAAPEPAEPAVEGPVVMAPDPAPRAADA